MSTDLKFSLVTTIIVLGALIPPRELALPHPFDSFFPSIVCE